MSDQSPKRPDCDLEKAYIIEDLFQVPMENRDEFWQEEFLDAVPTASFACREPQVLVGPDGFPYFALYSPTPGEPFESFCIQNLLDDVLLDNGIGVAVNPTNEGVDWVFSYGDLVNLRLRSEFYTPAPPMLSPNGDENDANPMIIAQPSEDILPKVARQALRNFMQQRGVDKPMVFLLTQTTEQDILESLVFNVFEEDFETTEAFNNVMQYLPWFLPRHYFLSRVPKDPYWITHFANL